MLEAGHVDMPFWPHSQDVSAAPDRITNQHIDVWVPARSWPHVGPMLDQRRRR